MSNSEKLYRFLLRAYSRGFRARYADPMQQLFRDRLRDTRGLADWIALWIRTLADWIISVPASYRPAATLDNPFTAFGNPARNCIFFARCEASSFASTEVTVNHLLLGVLRQQPTLVSELAIETIVRAIEAEEPLGRRVPFNLQPHSVTHRPQATPVELGPDTLQTISAATERAQADGRKQVTPSDLATAIRTGTDCLAARLLRDQMVRRH
jgi:hypothetical protein